MLRRTATVLAACAAILAASGGTASASCTDDLLATDFQENDAYATWNPSDHYGNWVRVDGTATIVIEGDDLLWDVPELVEFEQQWWGDTAGNVVRATTTFVDCVAG